MTATATASSRSFPSAVSAKMKSEDLVKSNAAPRQPPKKHHMTTSWPFKPRYTWNILMWYVWLLHVLPDLEVPNPPKLPKSAKVPFLAEYKQWLWILPRALVPFAIHRAYYVYNGGKAWSPLMAHVFFGYAFQVYAVICIRKMNDLAARYGYFDSEVKRDGVPDVYVTKIFISLVFVVFFRLFLGMFLFYDPYEKPMLSPWLPVYIFAYAVVLDFWFYVYHRAMHDIPWLWKYHRVHHLTKHPNPILSAFADVEQEIGDNLLVPLLTSITLRPDFTTWFIVQAFVVYTETMGHSGIRAYIPAPATGYILRHLGLEICVEDHDKHHSRGWRKSFNYGKQTRIWDTLFGTARPREESRDDNIDWNHPVSF